MATGQAADSCRSTPNAAGSACRSGCDVTAGGGCQQAAARLAVEAKVAAREPRDEADRDADAVVRAADNAAAVAAAADAAAGHTLMRRRRAPPARAPCAAADSALCSALKAD
eukprot:338369-Chlamydomonas_euryale.AAC.5